MKKILLILIGLLVTIGLILGVIYSGMLKDYNAYIDQVFIDEVDLSLLADGGYRGSSDAAGVISVDVYLELEDHVITKIELLKHDNGRGESANVIVDRVVDEQSLMVDTVSGATNSSIIILDAIQNALNNSLK